MVGGVTSVTVTVNEHEASCPLAAVTTKVFVVMPNGKLELLGKPAVWEVVGPAQLSAPTGVV